MGFLRIVSDIRQTCTEIPAMKLISCMTLRKPLVLAQWLSWFANCPMHQRVRVQSSVRAPLGVDVSLFFKKILKIYFQRRRREGEREGEKKQCVVAFCVSGTRDLACNPGMCPDWELDWKPIGSQVGPQSAEPHQSGLSVCFSHQHFSLSLSLSVSLSIYVQVKKFFKVTHS